MFFRIRLATGHDRILLGIITSAFREIAGLYESIFPISFFSLSLFRFIIRDACGIYIGARVTANWTD